MGKQPENDDQNGGDALRTWAGFTAERDSLPTGFVVNRGLRDRSFRESFAWHLSIIIDCKKVAERGMPTRDEVAVLEAEEADFDKRLGSEGNAMLLARITWNRTRHRLYRVRDPEVANDAMQGKIEAGSAVRAFDYGMEKDVEWKCAILSLGNRQHRVELEALKTRIPIGFEQ